MDNIRTRGHGTEWLKSHDIGIKDLGHFVLKPRYFMNFHEHELFSAL
jgi:hypothetical protein